MHIFWRVPRLFETDQNHYFRSHAFKDTSDRFIWWSEVNPQPIYLFTFWNGSAQIFEGGDLSSILDPIEHIFYVIASYLDTYGYIEIKH